MILDEGHMLKNMQSQRYQGLMKLTVSWFWRSSCLNLLGTRLKVGGEMNTSDTLVMGRTSIPLLPPFNSLSLHCVRWKVLVMLMINLILIRKDYRGAIIVKHISHGHILHLSYIVNSPRLRPSLSLSLFSFFMTVPPTPSSHRDTIAEQLAGTDVSS